MRQFKSTDLFAALRVTKEIGVKQELKDFANALANGKISAKTQREMGAELIFGLLGNCGSEGAEKAFVDFLAGPLEMTADELREMDLLVFMEKIKDFVEFIDMEAWKSFFTSLVDLIKRMKS